jgi:hypothetical protein
LGELTSLSAPFRLTPDLSQALQETTVIVSTDPTGTDSGTPDERTPFSKAASWTYHVLGISLGMAAPGVAGYFLDNWLGTLPVFLFLGVAFGTVYGIWRLLAVAKQMNRP